MNGADATGAIAAPESQPRPQPKVMHNAMLLLIAQIVVTPISVLLNAVAARHLGPTDFGQMYLATTIATFAFLFVEWGQAETLTGKVATQRERAGELLGSGLLFRVIAALAMSIVLPLVCWLFGYEPAFLVVLGLAILLATCVTIANAGQDVLRGYERTDFAAGSYVGWQVLTAAVAIPTLTLGGGLLSLMVAQVICGAIAAAFVFAMLPRMRVPRMGVRWETVKELVISGRPFLVFGLVMALQPLIDAALLSKFGSAEAMGWHAAARKLTGLLIYPASALIVALYPTLCRLHIEDPAGFRRATADALNVVTLGVVPIALGCALFPEIGVMIFSERSYGPAEDNLRVLAPFILLVYFSMPIGTCLAASGRAGIWAGVQFACVIVSAVAGPPLIIWFQANMDNGGLGVCVAAVLSEILMVAAGLYLLPSGILDRTLARRLGAAFVAGAAMAGVAWASSSINVYASAVLAVLAYAVVLPLCKAVTVTELRGAVAMLRKR